MSRPLRIAVENGWYHVLNRGIDGRQLFPDDHANEHFLELLESMPERFGLRIHAFVLMGNHYHLQIETLKPDLSRAIQWLNLSFSGWYNRFLQFGHFQGCHGIAVGQYGASGGGSLNHGWVADNVGRGALGEGFSFNLLTEQRYQILAGGTPSAKAPLR